MDQRGRYKLNVRLAQMPKGGVIMDVTDGEQARIVEKAGADSLFPTGRMTDRKNRNKYPLTYNHPVSYTSNFKKEIITNPWLVGPGWLAHTRAFAGPFLKRIKYRDRYLENGNYLCGLVCTACREEMTSMGSGDKTYGTHEPDIRDRRAWLL